MNAGDSAAPLTRLVDFRPPLPLPPPPPPLLLLGRSTCGGLCDRTGAVDGRCRGLLCRRLAATGDLQFGQAVWLPFLSCVSICGKQKLCPQISHELGATVCCSACCFSARRACRAGAAASRARLAATKADTPAAEGSINSSTLTIGLDVPSTLSSVTLPSTPDTSLRPDAITLTVSRCRTQLPMTRAERHASCAARLVATRARSSAVAATRRSNAALPQLVFASPIRRHGAGGDVGGDGGARTERCFSRG